MRNYLPWPSKKMGNRGRHWSVCWVLLLTACASVSSASDPVHVSLDQNQTRTLELGLNQRAIVEIASNPTTGYRWELNQITRERRCYIIAELPPDTSQDIQKQPLRAGAPTLQKWSLKIDPSFPCTQEQRISWTYRRSWEPLNQQNATTHLLLKPI